MLLIITASRFDHFCFKSWSPGIDNTKPSRSGYLQFCHWLYLYCLLEFEDTLDFNDNFDDIFLMDLRVHTHMNGFFFFRQSDGNLLSLMDHLS